MALDGGFLYNLTRELNAEIQNTRVEKVYQPSRDEIVLSLRKSGFQKKLLISARGSASRLHFTDYAPENPPTAPMFCMLLRKYIAGAKFVSVTQPSLERVVILKFQAYNEMGDIIYPTLICELITGASNIIFTDVNGIILDSLHHSDMEKNVRMIQPGAHYRLPESQDKINLLESDDGTVLSALKNCGAKNISTAFMKAFDGISPLISRETALICSSDLDKGVNDVIDKTYIRATTALKNNIINGQPYLLYKDEKPFDFSYMPVVQYGNTVRCEKAESFSRLLDEFYREREAAERVRAQSQDLLKLLTVLSARTARKINARKSDLKKCRDREKYRIYGELIKANIYKISRGDSEVSVVNYYDEAQPEITVPLNVALSPADNAQKYFKDYKKFCVAEKTLQTLIEDSEAELDYLDSVFDALSRAENSLDLAAIRDELAGGGYIKRNGTKKQKTRPSKPLEFRSHGGFTILVGKNNTQNDELTTRIADRNDIWFHTKGIHGSHVILRCGGSEVGEQDIIDAAMLAAYHSKGRESSSVPVDYTPVRYVKKPNGARPGMVIYTTNQTVYVTPSPDCFK